MLKPNTIAPPLKSLERAWFNFETVVKGLPSSDITALLLFYSRGLLDNFAKPPINLGYVRIVTLRVHDLLKVSPVDLGIDDMLTVLNETLDACLAEQGPEVSMIK